MNPSKARRLEIARRLAELEQAQLALDAIEQCTSDWPSDPRQPGYVGTRCDLLADHVGQHRHRLPGTNTVVRW